ncbi:MAG: DUF177 domain-containing protein [Oscillospiraceae bacterium]|nr:DUF177 domain-containing protein [Oscillospiraceae bacterium]
MVLSLKQAFLKEGFAEEIKSTLNLSDSSPDDPLKDPVRIEGTLKNSAGTVLLTLSADTVLRSVCARCLEEISLPFSGEFSHVIVENLSSEKNDADFIIAENDELDLCELVRSDLLLTIPPRFYCKEDCKGLCSICGKNLNTDSCDCKQEEFGSGKKLSNLSELLNK